MKAFVNFAGDLFVVATNGIIDLPKTKKREAQLVIPWTREQHHAFLAAAPYRQAQATAREILLEWAAGRIQGERIPQPLRIAKRKRK